MVHYYYFRASSEMIAVFGGGINLDVGKEHLRMFQREAPRRLAILFIMRARPRGANVAGTNSYQQFCASAYGVSALACHSWRGVSRQRVCSRVEQRLLSILHILGPEN